MTYLYANFLPQTKPARRDWLATFVANIPQFATQFNITPAEITRLQNGLIWIDYAAHLQLLGGTFQKSLTTFSDEMDTDDTENDAHAPLWQPDAAPTVAGSTGVFEFVISLVKTKIFVGGDAPAPNVLDALQLNPLAPAKSVDATIRSAVSAPGAVEISFSRGGYPQVMLESQRGNGGWELIKEVAGTHWSDARPNLAPGQSEVRQYRTRYSDGMQGVGNYSAVVSVATQA